MPDLVDLTHPAYCLCRSLCGTTSRSPHCPGHGDIGLRIGVDVHSIECRVLSDGKVPLNGCRCGIYRCAWQSCGDPARATIHFEGGVYRLCGDHWLLHDLGLLLTEGVRS